MTESHVYSTVVPCDSSMHVRFALVQLQKDGCHVCLRASSVQARQAGRLVPVAEDLQHF